MSEWTSKFETAIRVVERFPSVEQKNSWISVKEGLPERDKRVIVYIPEMNGSDCNIQISKGWGVSKYVTHWMPLPEPPEGENE